MKALATPGVRGPARVETTGRRAGARRDPWHAFCDAMDELHREHAKLRRENLKVVALAQKAVAAALAARREGGAR